MGVWKVVPALRTGDWRAKLVVCSQLLIGIAALLSLLSMLSRHPLLLVSFMAVQGLLLVGVVCFVIVALVSQRTLVVEEYRQGEVIFREGDLGRHVYIVKSGTVEVLVQQPDGTQRAIKQLGMGETFGEMALLRQAPRSATIRTVTAAQVFKVSPDDFLALYTHLPHVRETFNQIMAERLSQLERR